MDHLFIVGCPRSGTTMVQQALNRHSQIVIPPETKFFFSFVGHSRTAQHRHIERLNADLKINLPKPAKALRSQADCRAFYQEMSRQYLERVRKPNVVWFGEKTPEHTGRLPCIRRLFPQSKILVLYRDGRDVAASLSRMPWMPSNLYVNFLVWLYYYWVVQNEKRKGGAQLCFARYEDIVADPGKWLGGILQFLDLPYESAVVEGWGNREGVPEREYAWKARALCKISSDRVGSFRQELSDEQIAILERLGREALSSLGYPLLTDGQQPLSPSFFLKLSYAFSHFITRLPASALLKELCCRLRIQAQQPGSASWLGLQPIS
jgi:hypothetical protein